MKISFKCLCLVAALSSVGSLYGGQLTYVEAAPNTTGSDGNTMVAVSGVPTLISLGASGNVATSDSTTDNKWTLRTNLTLYNGDSFWMSDGGTNATIEDSAPLVVTIPGLTPGMYKFYVTFWGNAAGTSLIANPTNAPAAYDVAARVGSSGNYQLFKQQPNERQPDNLAAAGFTTFTVGTLASASDFSNTVRVGGPVVTGGTTSEFMHRGYLGIAPVGGSGSIDIWIDDPDVDVVNTRSQTRFDGVAYEKLLPGDFDTDGDVDGADFVAWQTHFPLASGAALADGDADGDGDVDGADFVVWQTNFPTTPGPGVTPVPEPASFAVALAALVGFGMIRRRALAK